MSIAMLGMVAIGGIFAGIAFVGAMARWVATVWEMARPEREDGSRRLSFGMAASVSVFTSGPWILLVVGFLAYQLREESWMPWFIGGAIIGTGFVANLLVSTYRKLNEVKGKNAA